MLPAGVVALVTRLALTGSSEAELEAMLGAFEPAARLLADARPDLIGFHCTAVSTFAPERAGSIRARIEAASGLPACSTADGILAALETLGVRRLVLVTPYIEPVHAREVAWLAAHGIEVTGGSCLGVNTNGGDGAHPARAPSPTRRAPPSAPRRGPRPASSAAPPSARRASSPGWRRSLACRSSPATRSWPGTRCGGSGFRMRLRAMGG